MDRTTPRDRIWYQMHQTYRKGCYYSDLSYNLRKRYMWFSLAIITAPLIALFLFQIDLSIWKWQQTKVWVVSGILLIVSLIEGYIAQTNLRGDISASRIMGVQFHKLAEKWRLLWIRQNREDIEEWIDHLEDLTNHMAVEHLSANDPTLRDQCQEEAINEFKNQFGETTTKTTTENPATPTPQTQHQEK